MNIKKKLTTELNKIPDENKDSSNLGLVMKEIEDSKYQLNSETLQEMFAKLVSATVDNRRNKYISPRYSMILSQLGPREARFLNILAKSNIENVLPCFRILSKNKITGGQQPISSKFIGLKFKIEPLYNDDSSLDILSSLGLVNYYDDSWLSADIAKKFYESAEKSMGYTETKRIYENETTEILIDKNCLKFTEFGKEFIKAVC